MKKQAGAVLVFKPGVTKAEAAKELAKLRDLLEHEPRVEEFYPEYGGPVWYIP